MCKFVDEFLLVAMLMVQLVAGLPVIALTKMVGIAFLVIYMVGIFFSISLVFATKFRLCCKGFGYFANEHGIFFFLIVHMALISLISYTTYMFTYPFFKGHDFKTFCDVNNLDENLSKTGCEKLQGYYAISLMSLTICNLASIYLLILGSRITKKNWTETSHARLLNKNEIC